MTGDAAGVKWTGKMARTKETFAQVKKATVPLICWPQSYLGSEYPEVTRIGDQRPQLRLKACRETGAGGHAT